MAMVALYLAPLVAVQGVGHRDEVAHHVLGRLRLAWYAQTQKGRSEEWTSRHTNNCVLQFFKTAM
jgi:hypothetical protein